MWAVLGKSSWQSQRRIVSFFYFPQPKLTYFVANYILRLFAESEVARDKLNLIERMQDAKIDFRQLLKFKDTIYAGDLDVDKEITEQQFR